MPPVALKPPTVSELPGDSDAVICADDFDNDPRFLRSAATRHEGCSSVIAAFPLRSNNQPIGMLESLGSALAPRDPRLDTAPRDRGGRSLAS
jgi:hypothetical protein